jgi:DNA-binding MarR family transcriptional regulator
VKVHEPRSRSIAHARPQRPSVVAWLRLARVFQKIDRVSAERFRCRGLSVAQFDVLAQVGAAEGITQQQLADSLLVTKGNVCQLIDRMEQAGLLERRHEGRANRLFLTERGVEVYYGEVPAQEELIATLFLPLSPEEQNQLLDLLRKLDRGLR